MTIGFSATSTSGLTVALRDVTQVSFRVGASTGTGLSYRLQYGDGVTETNPTFKFNTDPTFTHQYHALGAFSVQLTVTDQQGQSATASASVTVKSLTGFWGNVIKNPTNGLTETRLLLLTQGPTDGLVAGLTGAYTHPAGDAEPVQGTVEDTGTIRSLRTNTGSIVFSGDPGDGQGVSPDASALRLNVRGGSADGMVLTFSRQ
jgi:hypothetical protein